MSERKETAPPAGKTDAAAVYKDLAGRIIAELKAGTAPWQKPWNPRRTVAPERLNIEVSGRKDLGTRRANEKEVDSKSIRV